MLNSSDNKVIGTCKCGFSKEIMELSVPEKAEVKEEVGKGVSQEIKPLAFPHKCEKCGHDECYICDLGAPVSDESNIYLYQCTKCKWVERQADGSGNV